MEIGTHFTKINRCFLLVIYIIRSNYKYILFYKVYNIVNCYIKRYTNFDLIVYHVKNTIFNIICYYFKLSYINKIY